jgi:hypothetical protein
VRNIPSLITKKNSKKNINLSKMKNSYIYETKQTESITNRNSNIEYPNVLQYAEAELGMKI